MGRMSATLNSPSARSWQRSATSRQATADRPPPTSALPHTPHARMSVRTRARLRHVLASVGTAAGSRSDPRCRLNGTEDNMHRRLLAGTVAVLLTVAGAIGV